jgi:CRISPR-associated exonuclease Cas4
MLALVLIIIAVVLWLLATRAQRASGLPTGRVVYTDAGGWGRLEKPLFSHALQLTGKPDYLVNERGRYIPVEVKSGRAPTGGPYPAHMYQLAAYCALVAEAYQQRPTHGLIKYADKIFSVDYTPAFEAELLELLDSIRADAEAEDVTRSHDVAARCAACGFREVCDESLA